MSSESPPPVAELHPKHAHHVFSVAFRSATPEVVYWRVLYNLPFPAPFQYTQNIFMLHKFGAKHILHNRNLFLVPSFWHKVVVCMRNLLCRFRTSCLQNPRRDVRLVFSK